MGTGEGLGEEDIVPETGRKILHLDMDAFFAAIEQRDEPKYRGKPLIVGGNPWGRGVVSTCSYEARKFGIHSSMPSRRALELCPHAIFLPVRMEHYASVSREIFALFSEITDLVEPLSVDEAYLDVTQNFLCESSATRLAKLLQDRIFRETGLTASAGVSYNCFLAKVASGMRKPCGLTVITPNRAEEFLDRLPIRKFYGIGPATAEKLEARQIFTGADLRAISRNSLMELMGKMGSFYYAIVRGHDPRPVIVSRVRKSYGRECTFGEDLETLADAIAALRQIATSVAAGLREENLRGRTVTLKVRYDNFESITRSQTFLEPIADENALAAAATVLLQEKTEAMTRRIRLLGVTVSSFDLPTSSNRPVRYIQTELALIFS
jgi:DNA polymerase-4